MAAQEDLQTYIKSTWELIHPSTRSSGIMTDEEIRVKIDEAKKTVVEIIKDMEHPPTEQIRILGISAPDGTPLPFDSSSGSVPSELLEDSTDDAYKNTDPDDTENKHSPPSQSGVCIVGILAPDGTALPLPSTSTSASNDPKGSAEKPKPKKEKKIKFYWDEDHAGDFYDDYAEYVKEQGAGENRRHLYRLLFWLDFLSSGYNRNRQHFRHF